jgi:hypothetical protein
MSLLENIKISATSFSRYQLLGIMEVFGKNEWVEDIYNLNII